MYATSCTPKVLVYIRVFFFHFKLLKLYSVSRCWFTLALYTRKLFAISFLNNLPWVVLGLVFFCLFPLWASAKCLCRTVHNDCKYFTKAVIHYILVTSIYVHLDLGPMHCFVLGMEIILKGVAVLLWSHHK